VCQNVPQGPQDLRFRVENSLENTVFVHRCSTDFRQLVINVMPRKRGGGGGRRHLDIYDMLLVPHPANAPPHPLNLTWAGGCGGAGSGVVVLFTTREDFLQPGETFYNWQGRGGLFTTRKLNPPTLKLLKCGGPRDVPVQKGLAEPLVVKSPPWGRVSASGVDN
jgi:hypothetical protein